MNVSLITLYDAYNCGSFLQAYAMQTFLEQKGYSVQVVDCSTDSMRGLKRIIALTPRRTFIKLKRRYVYGKSWRKLHIVKIKNRYTYDCILIGSDEIWNMESPYFEHWKQYFAIEIEAKKIIAYAPSIGYSKIEKILGDTEKCAAIRRMNAVFARDEATRDLMKQLRKEEVFRVCDPTLLIHDQWYDLEEEYPVDFPYILLYSYGYDEKIQVEVQQYAQQRQIKIVSVAFDCKWADKVIIPTPLQFLYLVHHAVAIFGGTYHISVFATIYKKDFCIKSSMQKTKDFLSFTKQEWRMYKNSGDLKKILECNNKEEKDFELRELERYSSIQLVEAIEK